MTAAPTQPTAYTQRREGGGSGIAQCTDPSCTARMRTREDRRPVPDSRPPHPHTRTPTTHQPPPELVHSGPDPSPGPPADVVRSRDPCPPEGQEAGRRVRREGEHMSTGRITRARIGTSAPVRPGGRPRRHDGRAKPAALSPSRRASTPRLTGRRCRRRGLHVHVAGRPEVLTTWPRSPNCLHSPGLGGKKQRLRPALPALVSPRRDCKGAPLRQGRGQVTSSSGAEL